MQKPLLVILALACSLQAQDLSGTYTGTLKIETPDGPRDGSAAIIIKQDGDALTVTAGPRPEGQRAASKIERKGEAVKFEVVPPQGDGLMQFDVTIKDGKLTGKLTMTRGDQNCTGQLDLVKQ
jgi:hypothetical protein